MDKEKAMKYVVTSTGDVLPAPAAGKGEKEEKATQQKVEKRKVEGKPKKEPIFAHGERWMFVRGYLKRLQVRESKIEEKRKGVGFKWEDEEVIRLVQEMDELTRHLHREVAILWAMLRPRGKKVEERR